jgi:hypothetical protein
LLNEHNRIEKEFTEKSTSLQERNKQKDILSGSLKTNHRNWNRIRKPLNPQKTCG